MVRNNRKVFLQLVQIVREYIISIIQCYAPWEEYLADYWESILKRTELRLSKQRTVFIFTEALHGLITLFIIGLKECSPTIRISLSL